MTIWELKSLLLGRLGGTYEQFDWFINSAVTQQVRTAYGMKKDIMTEEQANTMIQLLDKIWRGISNLDSRLSSIESNTGNISFSTNDLDNVVDELRAIKKALKD